jgi:hypothetical protein
MKKILFVLLLTFSPFSLAQWTFLGETPRGDQHYLDLSTVQQVGQYKRAWVKTEYSANSEMAFRNGILSIREYYEYDCLEKKHRLLSLHAAKQSNLKEIKFIDNKVGEWRFIAKKSVSDAELAIICKAK